MRGKEKGRKCVLKCERDSNKHDHGGAAGGCLTCECCFTCRERKLRKFYSFSVHSISQQCFKLFMQLCYFMICSQTLKQCYLKWYKKPKGNPYTILYFTQQILACFLCLLTLCSLCNAVSELTLTSLSSSHTVLAHTLTSKACFQIIINLFLVHF